MSLSISVCHSIRRTGAVVAGVLAATAALQAGSAVRSAHPESGRVEINTAPTTGVAAYTLEEFLPEGTFPRDISHEGVFDHHVGTIKWGPFTDDEPRMLSYRLVAGTTAGEVTVAGNLTEPGQTPQTVSGIANMTLPPEGLESFVAQLAGSDALDRPPGQADADEDGDGWPLVVEYALGMDPLTPDKPSIGLGLSEDTANLQVDLRQRVNLPDVALAWSRSTDLNVWEKVPLTDGQVLTDHGDGIQTLRYQVTASAQQEFLRWQVLHLP